MSIKFIGGIVQVICGILMLVEGYLVARDKIKPKKSSIVIKCIIISILFFSNSLSYF
ncbi:MAG: hypothetical protein ACI8WT_000195 [Clostridium sp.]|jgi:hypothetical protein